MGHIAILLTLAASFFILQAHGKNTIKNETAETKRLDNIFDELVRISRLIDAEVPPYDPSKPPTDNGTPPEEIPEQVIPPETTVPPPEVMQKPPYYYPYPRYDESWRKCCKLEKAKECCLENAQDLSLYNLGTGMYYFHNDMNTAKNWYDALHFCRAHGMELVTIETAAENSVLTSYVNWFLGGQTDFYAFYWTSLNDLGTEGKFTWAGTGFPATYFSWHNSGQPDGGIWENCGEIWQTAIGTTLWNERSCLQWKGRFICEMSKICYDIISAGYE